jgi:hypothetical protein
MLRDDVAEKLKNADLVYFDLNAVLVAYLRFCLYFIQHFKIVDDQLTEELETLTAFGFKNERIVKRFINKSISLMKNDDSKETYDKLNAYGLYADVKKYVTKEDLTKELKDVYKRIKMQLIGTLEPISVYFLVEFKDKKRLLFRKISSKNIPFKTFYHGVVVDENRSGIFTNDQIVVCFKTKGFMEAYIRETPPDNDHETVRML